MVLKNIGKNWSITNLFWLNLKRVYSEPATAMVVIFSPFFVTFALSVMLPFYIYVAIGQIFTTTLSAGVIWGMTFYPFKKSTFQENISLTRSKSINIYIAIFMTMIFVTMWSQVTFWSLSIILETLNLTSVMGNFFNYGSSQIEVKWRYMDWFTIGYTWALSVTIIFLMSMGIKEWVHNDKTYFLILLIFLLMLVPFGGTLPPRSEMTESGIQVGRHFNVASYIGLVFPQFHINTLLYTAISPGIYITESGLTHTMGYMEKYDSFTISTDWKWNISVFYPPSFILLNCSWIFIQKYIV